MQRCPSPEQFDDLVAGRLEPIDLDAAEAHLEACPDCRKQFLDHTRVADAEEWRRAAWELLPPTASEAALLATLKMLEAGTPVERVGRAADHAALFNGDSSAEPIWHAPPPWPVSRGARWPTIPGFEILGELGRGGMGVVYKARQVAHDRIVALKMILSGRAASAEDLGRFHDEAEAVSRLRHPHIVQIFEVGQAEDRLYFVLEFVEGGTLAEKIKGRSPPTRSSAQLMESLARAMHYAHQRGIIHRDLKPANVLLHGRKAFLDFPENVDHLPEEWDFRRFMPKITDFGLAKLMDRGTEQGHTASGDVVGTPSYMAPEQAQGKPYAIGPATDVYALGTILYEMLTGRPPFHGATPMDILIQVHTQQPVAPRKIVRDIPAGLETICLKCLRKDPNQRYNTAEALAEDLRLFLDGQPLQTRSMRGFELARLGGRIGGWILVAFLFVLAVGVGAVLVSMWLHRGEQKATGGTPVAAAQDDTAALAREAARLRLRLALVECERGEPAGGLFDMAAMLEAGERDPSLPEFATARLNLAAWGKTLPELQWMSAEPARVAALAPGKREVYVADLEQRVMIAGPDGEPRPAGLVDAIGASALSVAANGSTLAAITADGLRWYELGSGALIAHVTTLPKPERPEVSPDGSTLLVKSNYEGNALWLVTRNDAARQHRIEKLGVPATATAWAWHPKGTHILVGYADGAVEVKELESSNSPPPRPRQPAPVTAVAWLNDGATMVIACADGFVRFRNLPSFSTLEPPVLRAHAPGPVLLATHAKGFILTAGADRLAKLWRATSGELLASLPHPAAIQKVACTADGGGFMTHDAQGTVRVWSVPESRDGKPVSREGVERGDERLVLFGLEFEAGGTAIRTMDDRHHVRRWDAKTGQELEPQPAPPAKSWVVAYNAAGNRHLAMGPDGIARLQVIDRHEPLLPTLPGEFRTAEFSGDGRLLLTACAHGVRLYDAATGLAVGPLLPLANLQGARFGRDGRQVVAWSATEARTWDVPEPRFPSGLAWRSWLHRRTGLDRTADGALRFLTGAEWKSAH
jgi:WD40 repeat protein